jgi:hypothetical protein
MYYVYGLHKIILKNKEEKKPTKTKIESLSIALNWPEGFVLFF